MGLQDATLPPGRAPSLALSSRCVTADQVPAISRELPEAPLSDVMAGAARWTVKVHEHGFVALVDVMPRLAPADRTADYAVVQAARVSYGLGTKHLREDRGLIRYLMRHRHTTPFEMVELKFHCRLPIFVARQWIRHRTANVNEYSGRYSILPDEYYRPARGYVRTQSSRNRQGGEEPADDASAEAFEAYLEGVEAEYASYEALLDRGVSRELARIGLPLSIYTEWYWKCDLHNVLHFLSLRMHPHAQREMRDYAHAMFALIQPLVPLTCEAFVDYELQGVNLSRLEVEAIREGRRAPDTTSQGELAEWEEKKRHLGL
jgi:thymidylate synthase (FAD)